MAVSDMCRGYVEIPATAGRANATSIVVDAIMVESFFIVYLLL
jgi:hypothetical protein